MTRSSLCMFVTLFFAGRSLCLQFFYNFSGPHQGRGPSSSANRPATITSTDEEQYEEASTSWSSRSWTQSRTRKEEGKGGWLAAIRSEDNINWSSRRPISSSAARHRAPRAGRLRVGLCVIGQTQRLELRSKVANIVFANPEVDFYVVGLLSAGIPKFSNPQKLSGLSATCYSPKFSDADYAAAFRDAFSPSSGGGSRRPEEGHRSEEGLRPEGNNPGVGPTEGSAGKGRGGRSAEQEQNRNVQRVDVRVAKDGEQKVFVLTEDILKVFGNYRLDLGEEARRMRFQHEPRRWTKYRECAEWVEKVEQEESIKFDFVIRMRDGGVVTQPLLLRKILGTGHGSSSEGEIVKEGSTSRVRSSWSQRSTGGLAARTTGRSGEGATSTSGGSAKLKNTAPGACLLSKQPDKACVLTKDCMNWGGYSDKFWMVARVLVRPLLFEPISDLLQAKGYLLLPPLVKGSEPLVKKLWDHKLFLWGKNSSLGQDNRAGVLVRITNPSVLPVTDMICREEQENLFLPPIFKVYDYVADSDSSMGGGVDCIAEPWGWDKQEYSLSDEETLPPFRDAAPDLKPGYESGLALYYPSSFSTDGRMYVQTVRRKLSEREISKMRAFKTALSDTRKSPVELRVYNTKSGAVGRTIGNSTAYNTQYGARTQWIGLTTHLIYNYRKGDAGGVQQDGQEEKNFFGARIVDAESGAVLGSTERAVFSLNAAGTVAAALNFARLFALTRNHGYEVSPETVGNNANGPKPPPFYTSTPARLLITPRFVVDWLLKRRRKIYHRSSRHPKYGDYRQGVEDIATTFVWFEEAQLNDAGDRVAFRVRAKLGNGGRSNQGDGGDPIYGAGPIRSMIHLLVRSFPRNLVLKQLGIA